MLEDLYKDVILKHAIDPVGHGRAIAATHSAARDNPLCGDHITVHLEIQGDRVSDAAFEGDACAVCLASCSLMCAHLPGMAIADLGPVLDGFAATLSNEPGAPCPDFLEPLLAVRAWPARHKCALLPWQAAVGAASR